MLMLVVGFWNNPLDAQERDLRMEILVYVLPDSLLFPADEKTAVPISRVSIPSQALAKAINQIHPEAIAKAFPNWADSDTIRIREDGVRVRLPQVSRIFRIQMQSEADVDIAIARLSKEPSVLFAEKHSDMKLHVDDQYPDQWHLNNTGQTGGTPDADIDAPGAWSLFEGSSAVKLGVIDTGVEINHDDLDGKSSGDLPESYPYDSYAHGTHVAGIGAAKKGGGDVRGVDAYGQVISRKVFSGYHWDPYLGRDVASWAGDNNAYNKIVSAVNNGANVLNHSYGGSQYSTTLRLAFAYAYKMNRVSVASMGNDNTSDPRYPAAFGQGIIAVGATDHNDDHASWSNTGNHIDVAAPGVLILSTWRGNGYHTISGTSMAAPNVSGIATLLKGYNSSLYNDDIENIIRFAIDDKGPLGWDDEYGTGRINARDALDLISSPNEVKQWTASGGSSVGNTGTYQAIWYSVPGLADGVYIVKRYDVRKTVTFPQSFASIPYAWGRGVATNGYSAANPNFAMGWSKVVSGSVTGTQATLQTYVYQVWTILGYYLGWYPASPSNATFAYTVLAPPPENLTLENLSIGTTEVYVATNSITAGPNFTVENTGDVTFQAGNVITLKPGFHAVAGGKFHAYIDTSLGGGSQPMIAATVPEVQIIEEQTTDEEADEAIPTVYSLSHNYPNPFNPNTTIRFGLPEASEVKFVVYDLLGREVDRLADRHLEPGYYQVVWQGRDASGRSIPSGVYIARIVTPKYTKSIKMLLLK